MVEDFDAFVEWLQQTRPSCLSACVATPAVLPEPWDDNPKSVWQLSCHCGSSSGRLLGYPLKDYNPGYDGPEIFLSPLGFECSACKLVMEFLDTDVHGYHAEIARREGDGCGSAKLRGSGPRQAFRCPKCNDQTFSITTAFVFWGADELAEEFDGEQQDLFNVFLCYGTCARCGHVSQPTDFGKL